jgi:hypothetical protein
VHKHSAKRSLSHPTLRRRIVALFAAYAIALSSLIASFGVARAAAETAAVPGGIICHSALAGQQLPSRDEGNDTICADCCCTGCMMTMATMPPPPAGAIAVPQSAAQAVTPPAVIVLAYSRESKSHRSRAPPVGA